MTTKHDELLDLMFNKIMSLDRPSLTMIEFSIFQVYSYFLLIHQECYRCKDYPNQKGYWMCELAKFKRALFTLDPDLKPLVNEYMETVENYWDSLDNTPSTVSNTPSTNAKTMR